MNYGKVWSDRTKSGKIKNDLGGFHRAIAGEVEIPEEPH